MKSPEEQAREKRRQDRIGGTIFIVGGAVMSVASVLKSIAVPLPGRLGAEVLYGGLAVWTVMAILGIIMVKRGAEKPSGETAEAIDASEDSD